MPRKALIIGIDEYKHLPKLVGSKNDAKSLGEILDKNGDGTNNFDVELILNARASRKKLMSRVENHFKFRCEAALFYFSGHGSMSTLGGELHACESEGNSFGLPMNTILKMANDSPAIHKIIILDCCSSGSIGDNSEWMQGVTLGDGVIVMTASRPTEEALEFAGGGIFTKLIINALEGAASNILGTITPLGLYNYVDNNLSWTLQRPLLKTNINTTFSIRRVQPAIKLFELQEIVNLFPSPKSLKFLAPSFEPDASIPDSNHVSEPNDVKNYRILQKYNRLNLLVPSTHDHMYDVAMESGSCELTPIGEYYWQLVNNNRI